MVLALALAICATSAACPVCYGETEGGNGSAINAAVLVLLGLTGTVLGFFGALFLRIKNRIQTIQRSPTEFTSKN
jgi:hypothetical protein